MDDPGPIELARNLVDEILTPRMFDWDASFDKTLRAWVRQTHEVNGKVTFRIISKDREYIETLQVRFRAIAAIVGHWAANDLIQANIAKYARGVLLKQEHRRHRQALAVRKCEQQRQAVMDGVVARHQFVKIFDELLA
jgi:hypothetical protein